MRVVCFLVLALGFVSASPLAGQETASQDPAQELALLSIKRSDFAEQAVRLRYVETLKAYCHALGAAYPKNSPSEDTWVLGELKSGSVNRASRALGSAEFGRLEAARFIDECVNWTNNYISNANGRREIKSIALFSLIRALIRYAPDAEHFAKMNGLDENRWAFLALDDTAGSLAEIGQYELFGVYEP